MWDRGYEAVSPRDLLEASGVGAQAALAPFQGKIEPASVARGDVSDEWTRSRRACGADGSALDRIFR